MAARLASGSCRSVCTTTSGAAGGWYGSLTPVKCAISPASASALLGGVVRRSGVTVAVSTGGRAPALAGLLREALEAVLPDDLGAWVEIGERARAGWKQRGLPMGERRPLLLKALQELYAAKEKVLR